MTGNRTIDPERQARLAAIIKRLHAGEPAASVKKDFARLIEGVSAEEIAEMEQALVDGGMPVEEIQRLCEVHVDVFKVALSRPSQAARIPGHPVHSLIAENRAALPRLRRLLRAATALVWRGGSTDEARAALTDLSRIIIHYQRKENEIFPRLERAGFPGPSKVMWGKHDEIRAVFKELGAALEALDGLRGDGRAFRAKARDFRSLARRLAGKLRVMFFMEERILVPNALSRFSEADWAEIRRGEGAIGWAWIAPGAAYDPALVQGPRGKAPSLAELIEKARPGQFDGVASPAPAPAREGAGGAKIELNTGALSADLLDLVLRKLPLDLSVVDEEDRVAYYSDSPDRVFPRSPGVIGRDVRNCHPQKSLAVVERILGEFRDGTKDSARFWIEMGGKFLVIDYLALRDASGRYRGALETTQDATAIRALEGQRRLLDWDAREPRVS